MWDMCRTARNHAQVSHHYIVELQSTDMIDSYRAQPIAKNRPNPTVP